MPRSYLSSLREIARYLRRSPEKVRNHFLLLAGQVSRPDAILRRQLLKETKRRLKATKVERIEAAFEKTGIRKLRKEVVFTSPNVFPPEHFEQHEIANDDTFREAVQRMNCYVCKKDYVELHHFYDQLCPDCATLNFAKRTESADLTGRVALLTGGRVKIGYQAGLKLLRAGAHLIVTTRFPRDSAARYAREPDFAQWSDRLEIFGLDLRHTPSVEAFCRELLRTRDRLDFIVNNACQTVRRPPEFYEHMMEGENAALHELPDSTRKLLGSYEGLRGYHMLPEGDGASVAAMTQSADNGSVVTSHVSFDRHVSEVAGLTPAAQLSQVKMLPEELEAQKGLFPEGKLDQDLQQVDLRGRNSWRLLMDEVPSVELLEVQLVNAIAPFIINARLKPLMLRTANRDKHIVNVSAVEGQFYRKFKTTRHPHTNMAKAALNMMTRTSAADYHNGWHPHERGRYRLGDGRGPCGDRGAQGGGASLSSAARHCGWCGAYCRSHYSRNEHGYAHVGFVSEGLRAHGLVGPRGLRWQYWDAFARCRRHGSMARAPREANTLATATATATATA